MEESSTDATPELTFASSRIEAEMLLMASGLKLSVRNPATKAARISAMNACRRSLVIRKIIRAMETNRVTNGHQLGAGAAAAIKCIV
jgi:hypothetical protein